MHRREFNRRLALAGASGVGTASLLARIANGQDAKLPSSEQTRRQPYVSRAETDESPLEFGKFLADKFITAKPQVYYPRTTETEFFPWCYPTGVALWALCQLSDVSSDPRYLAFVRESFDFYIDEGKVVCRTMNHGGAMGHALFELNQRHPDRRYLDTVRMITDFYENRQPRLPDGSFCYYQEPERRRTWIDALFIVCPVLAKSAELLGQPQRYDEVLRQFFNYTVRLQDPELKLYYQGWGWGTNRTTHSPGFWSRGNGWVLMAMTEVLKTIPPSHRGWKKLFAIYHDFAEAVLNAQGADGLWHQLMTRHDSFEETSGTAMFIYSFVHGHQCGWLAKEFLESAIKAFAGLKTMVDVEGNIYNTCVGTGTQSTLEDYYRRPTPINDCHGIGPVILAACAVALHGV